MLHFQDVSQVIAIEECFGLVQSNNFLHTSLSMRCKVSLSTLMLISGSKPYRARHTGTIASGLIKKTNWSRLVDTDQGTMIKTTFNNNCKLIKMIKNLLPCPSEFVTGLRSQIRVSDSNKCHKLTACSTSYPSKSFVKCAIVLRATQKTLSFCQTWICGRSEKSDLFVRFKKN